MRYLTILILLFSLESYAMVDLSYDCKIYKKHSLDRDYTKENLKKYKYRTEVVKTGSNHFLKRCSLDSFGNPAACDVCSVDKVVRLKSSRKYYCLSNGLDVEIFSNTKSIENFSGTVSYGQCMPI